MYLQKWSERQLHNYMAVSLSVAGGSLLEEFFLGT